MTVDTDQRALDGLCVDTIRTLSMDAVQQANSGHPGTPMALAPVAYVLYTRVMRHSPEQPDWPGRDRFVLSCGHASMLLYATLHLAGYDVGLDQIKRFRQLDSPCAGHPEYGHVPGVETTTGPLGQGLATAVGMAIGERMLAARFNRGEHAPIDSHTYFIASDGDMEEGIASEASSIAGHLGLGKLIGFYDDNHISIEGDTALAFSEDVGARYEAYGWHVQNLHEDLELDRLEEAIEEARRITDRPSLIVIRTHIAPGSPNKQDTHGAHGAPLGEEEIRLTKEAYGYPSMEPFFVPEPALEHFRGCVERGRTQQADWQERFEAYRGEHGAEAAELERWLARTLPDGFGDEVPSKGPDAGMIATRKASQEVIQWAAAEVPELVGGSADLAPSTLTLIDDGGDVAPGEFGGRNLHFGIREHAMGAIVNGLTLTRFPRLRRRLPDLQRLHEGRDPAGRRDAHPLHVRVHARLDRRRRGRADAPADRAARDAARDAQPRSRATGRLQRDGARLAPCAAPDRPADGARAVASGAAGVRPRGDPRPTRSSAAPTCSRRPPGAIRR